MYPDGFVTYDPGLHRPKAKGQRPTKDMTDRGEERKLLASFFWGGTMMFSAPGAPSVRLTLAS